MRCYVYAIVVDGIIRYIGKGSARGGKLSRFHDHMRAMRRLIRHRAEGLPVPPQRGISTIASQLAHAWLDGAEISELIVADGLTDEEALAREAAEIEAAPKGQLWNRPLTFWHLLEFARSGRKLSPEARAKIAAGVRAHWQDPEKREAHRQALRGVKKQRRTSNVIELQRSEK
jgi:hypothetical protein